MLYEIISTHHQCGWVDTHVIVLMTPLLTHRDFFKILMPKLKIVNEIPKKTLQPFGR
jgi:hypothetical protein